MSDQNPYQSPNLSELRPTETVRIAKAFSYENDRGSKGIIFHGAIFASSDGLFICHDKHAWKSTQTAMAAFGLIGVGIHYLMTRNKKFEYPFPTLPVDDIPDSIRDRISDHKFKDKTVVSIVPRDSIRGYSSSFTKGKKFMIGNIELVLVAPVKKGLKQLPDMGYEVI